MRLDGEHAVAGLLVVALVDVSCGQGWQVVSVLFS